MKWTIDRFEGAYALCEDETGKLVEIAKDRLPANAVEGDVLYLGENGYGIDREETVKRRAAASEKMNRLWE